MQNLRQLCLPPSLPSSKVKMMREVVSGRTLSLETGLGPMDGAGDHPEDISGGERNPEEEQLAEGWPAEQQEMEVSRVRKSCQVRETPELQRGEGHSKSSQSPSAMALWESTN